MAMTRGVIQRLIQPHKRRIGFISSPEAGRVDIFFHGRNLDFPIPFGDGLIGMEVEFDLVSGPKGVSAEMIRPARPARGVA
jgi:cold shock CspA family protein